MRLRYGVGRWLTLGFVVQTAVLSLTVMAERTSEVRVGQLRAPVVDAMARIVDLSGNPSLDVYLFSQPVDPKVKAEILSRPSFSYSAIVERIGHAPVLNLQFIFEAGAKRCSKGQMLTYTAVLEKSATFPFESARESAINFSTDKSEGGISELSCEFATGSPVRIKLRRTVTADRIVLPALLPPGKSRLNYSWDIDITSEVTKGM